MPVAAGLAHSGLHGNDVGTTTGVKEEDEEGYH